MSHAILLEAVVDIPVIKALAFLPGNDPAPDLHWLCSRHLLIALILWLSLVSLLAALKNAQSRDFPPPPETRSGYALHLPGHIDFKYCI